MTFDFSWEIMILNGLEEGGQFVFEMSLETDAEGFGLIEGFQFIEFGLN